nr:hypothetical protein [Bacteroidota bacterium]
MKRLLYLFFYTLLFTAGNTIAQTYPAYMSNVVDTSSTGYYFVVPIIIGGGPGNNPTQMILDRYGDVVYCK